MIGGPAANWEFGTRDTGAYATMSDVVSYLDWLGGEVSEETDRRHRLEAAAHAIKAHEASLTEAMINGIDNLVGLRDTARVEIIGGADNALREGLVSLRVKGMPSADLVAYLRDNGIRAHVRKDDHYSGNILKPLGWSDCVRISLCHYNTIAEVKTLLSAFAALNLA